MRTAEVADTVTEKKGQVHTYRYSDNKRKRASFRTSGSNQHLTTVKRGIISYDSFRPCGLDRYAHKHVLSNRRRQTTEELLVGPMAMTQSAKEWYACLKPVKVPTAAPYVEIKRPFPAITAAFVSQ